MITKLLSIIFIGLYENRNFVSMLSVLCGACGLSLYLLFKCLVNVRCGLSGFCGYMSHVVVPISLVDF